MKICLCGSTRFRKEYEKINRLLSQSGHVVHTVSSFVHEEDDITPDIKETLDLVHLQKVSDSDVIVIVGEIDGQPYLGESTKREVKWAMMQQIEVIALRDCAQLLAQEFVSQFYTFFGFDPPPAEGDLA